MTTVYCGLDSGPDPSPGLGVALSLREGFADLHIVGVGVSADAAGLHHPVFDEVWIPGPGPGRSADAILERLDAGALWIAGSGREARTLSLALDGHRGLLSPSPDALERFDGAGADLAHRLGALSPPSISTHQEDWQLVAFGREHGWRLWLSGPDHGPLRIDGWRSLEGARAGLAGSWSAGRLRLRADVRGNGESIVFAAHRGEALGARHMRCTGEGSPGTPWAGHVADLADELPAVASALERELSGAAWTGGGELELVRSIDGALWLVACHPRFAPWVHGASLAGANLPCALVGAATGRDPAPAARRARGFVRVVVELALRPGFELSEPVTAATGVVRAGNYLSGMPEPAGRASAGPGAHPREDAAPPAEPLRSMVSGLRRADSTPHVHAIDPGPRWRRLGEHVRAAAGSRRVEIAYSIKTDPDLGLLHAARDHGFLAEAITAAEMRRALQAGFAGDEIILNGPAKRWPASAAPLRTFAAFADSLGELAELAGLAGSGALTARYIGPRLRPPSVASRFGVQLGDFGMFSGLVEALRRLPPGAPVGLHVHWASSEAGHETWFAAIEATLEWGRCLQDLSGRAIGCVDLGGGWQPDDFDTAFLPRLPELVARCHAELDELEVIVLEPGRALVQPLAVVETTVLELRSRGGAREIVVDASLAEVPRAGVYPHRVLSRGENGWRQWGRGPDRMLGRLCMEDDVLRAGVALPDEIEAGARVLIADAGAYDRSMAYSFGRG
jgi:diaminopimelate decarboxylase